MYKRCLTVLVFCFIAIVGQIYAAPEQLKADTNAPTPARAASRVQNYDGAWWIKAHQGRLAQVKKGNADLVFLGDSITDGWGWRNGAPVWKQYYANRKALNLGISGDRTEHVLWRLAHGTVDGLSPKLTVLLIGTNNTGKNDRPEDVARGIKAILSELRTRLPETKILLMGVFPRSWQPTDPLRKANNNVNTIIAKYADNKHIFYLDIGQNFLKDDGTFLPGVTGDSVHLTTRGYEIWAETMEPTICKLMGKPELSE